MTEVLKLMKGVTDVCLSKEELFQLKLTSLQPNKVQCVINEETLIIDRVTVTVVFY